MPDRHEAAEQVSSTDPLMGTIVLFLVVLLAAVIALALGLSWKGLLHWTGELLLILGIALAAIGISDVRSEWTQLPGIRGRVLQAAQAFRIRAASFLWACWNRTLGKWPRVARWLHLRAHGTAVNAGVATVGVKAMAATGTGKVTRGTPPADGTNEERLAWLEGHIAEMPTQIDTLHARHEQEVKDRQDATDQEQAARMVEDQRIRERLADLAGGGLRLQAWGVACLLVGTVITAVW